MPAGLSRGITAAHVSTHRTGGDRVRGVQKGAVGNRILCGGDKEKRHKDPKPCRQTVQNSKADSPNKRQGRQNLGL